MADSALPPPAGSELEIEVDLLSPLEDLDDSFLQSVEEDDVWVGRTLEGRYRIKSLLAVGGMGRVYRAVQESLKRPVVVKILDLPPGSRIKDPLFQERFALEAETASRLSHPNSVTIFDFGHTQDGVFYIVMEFVDGTPLNRLLRIERRFEPVRALLLVRQVCRALREAHACHIVHRDLKPSNILVIHKGDEGESVKVLDFGLAKILAHGDESGTNLTRVGTFIGTPEYAAPEVTQYGEADTRADIYSVGVLLYRMLRGKVPFRGRTDAATLVMSVHESVPPFPSELGLPRRLESTIYRCLEKEPKRRFQSMDELLPALATCLVELGVESASLVAPSIVSPSLVRLNVERTPTPGHLSLKSESAVVEQPTPTRSYMQYAIMALVFVCGIGATFLFFQFKGDSGVDAPIQPQNALALPVQEDPQAPLPPVPIEAVNVGALSEVEAVNGAQTEEQAAVETKKIPEVLPTATVQKPKAPAVKPKVRTVKPTMKSAPVKGQTVPPKTRLKVTLPQTIYSEVEAAKPPPEEVAPEVKPTLALPFKSLYSGSSSEKDE